MSETGDFGYSVVLADSFDQVLDRTGGPARDIDVVAFAQFVRRSACTLLQARGGAGKSYTSDRLAGVLAKQGVWSVTVPAVDLAAVATDLGDWTPGDWARAADDTGAGDAADGGEPGLIVVDGLNEVARDSSERVLDAVGPLTAAHPQVTFLITDRLTRRANASPHWKYATLSPVPDAVIRRVAGTEPTEALGIPFYLERHANGTAAHQILEEAIAKYVPEERLPALAEAAYMSYERLHRRELDAELVPQAVGKEAWRRLLEAREVVRSGRGEHTQFQFVHHLLHDFLAGRHVASDEALWNSDAFDVVTLHASSFDALALALAQVRPGEKADKLVQYVYDWNFYAAAYMLEEDRASGSRVGDAVFIAMTGAIAEKRFDAVLPTIQRVEDALRVQQSSLSVELLQAASRDEVVGVLRQQSLAERPPWFDRWEDLFTRADGSPASAADVETMSSDEPVLGWAASNALRRLRVAPKLMGEIRSMLQHENPTVRWRAAHALGSHSDPENLSALRETLRTEPPKSWVAYGALRSEFEQLRLMPSAQRAVLLAEIAGELGSRIAEPGPLRSEAIRCLDVSPLPENWHRDVEPLLVILWETADARGAAELASLAERLRRRKERAGAA